MSKENEGVKNKAASCDPRAMAFYVAKFIKKEASHSCKELTDLPLGGVLCLAGLVIQGGS